MTSRDHLPGAMATFIAIDTVVILVRLWVRLTMTKIGYDDYAIVVALAGFILMCAFCFVALAFGFGISDAAVIATFPGYNSMEGSKYFTIAQTTYVASFGVVRISVALVLYRIVAGIKQMQRLLVGSIIVVGLYSLVCMLVDLTQCIPLKAVWGDGTGKCISSQTLEGLGFAVSALDIASALLYAVLPIFLVKNLQMSLKTKISVVFLLSLGAFTVVFSFVRLKSLIKIGKAVSTAAVLDLELESFLYSVLEFGMSILTASLVGLQPLLKYLSFGRSSRATGGRHSNATGCAAKKANTFELSGWNRTSSIVRLHSYSENRPAVSGV